MALGALVDAGAELPLVERELAGLPVGGWRLSAQGVTRCGVAATQVRVEVSESTVVRTYNHIVGLLTEARLPERARTRALAAFERLAAVESLLHRRPVSQVHFHEVGSLDAIVDIVGVSVALEILGVDRVLSSPVAQGVGMVHSSHGNLPVPAPAVLRLLEGAPTYGTSHPYELTTPTGAALLAATCEDWGPMPAMSLLASGYGAGSRELDGTPNVVQVVVGEADQREHNGEAPVVLLEANLDDVTGEILGHTISSLMSSGALDAWVTPVTGKKGRPAHVVSVLCDHSRAFRLRELLASETGTLGVRSQAWQRWVAPRSVDEVKVRGFPVRVKRGPSGLKAEHEDAARVAARLGLPVREVARLAEEAARSGAGGPGGLVGRPGGEPAK